MKNYIKEVYNSYVPTSTVTSYSHIQKDAMVWMYSSDGDT